MDSAPTYNSTKTDHQSLLRKKFQIQKQVDYQDQKLRFLDMPKIPFRHASIIRDNFTLITEENLPIENMLLCKECHTVHAFPNKNHGNLLRHVRLHQKFHGPRESQESTNRALAEQVKEIKPSKKRKYTVKSRVHRPVSIKVESDPLSMESPASPPTEERSKQKPIEIPTDMACLVTNDEEKKKKKKPAKKNIKKIRLLMKLPRDSLNSPPILDLQA